jgi:hypothetical protein
MYLVELRPGKEELYRTSDELALAIRNGDVDARSRVYHRATAKWISITLHPQYKAIVAASKEEPVVRPTRRGWGILGNGSPDKPAKPSPDATPSNGNLLSPWRRPLALGLAGLLLISGIQLAFSGPRPPWAERSRAGTSARQDSRTQRVQRAERPTQTRREALGKSELVSLASTRNLWADQPRTDTLVSSQIEGATPVLPRAPRLRSRSLREALALKSAKEVDANSLDAVFARYSAAHDSARAQLETGLRVARLSRLFAASRLSPDGGVSHTRMSLAGLVNFIRVFRQQQTTIEAAYEDSVTQLAKQQRWSPKKVRRWYSRPAQKESPSLELLSGTLVASIDSILGVLDAQAGAYKLRGSAIAFEDPTAGQAYGALRRRIKEQIDAAVAADGASSSGPTGLLLQAIGTTTLPRET